MDIKELREQINEIDEKLVELFLKRMEVSAGVAAYKKERGLPVFDAQRERSHLQELQETVQDTVRESVRESVQETVREAVEKAAGGERIEMPFLHDMNPDIITEWNLQDFQ